MIVELISSQANFKSRHLEKTTQYKIQ